MGRLAFVSLDQRNFTAGRLRRPTYTAVLPVEFYHAETRSRGETAGMRDNLFVPPRLRVVRVRILQRCHQNNRIWPPLACGGRKSARL